MTRRMAPTTWTRIAAPRWSSASIRRASRSLSSITSFYTTVNMIHTMEDAARPAADEQQRCLCRRDGSAVQRSRGPAAVQGRLSQPRQRQRSTRPMRRRRRWRRKARSWISRLPTPQTTTILNAILWKAAKGDVPMPEPRHTVLPRRHRSNDAARYAKMRRAVLSTALAVPLRSGSMSCEMGAIAQGN